MTHRHTRAQELNTQLQDAQAATGAAGGDESVRAELEAARATIAELTASVERLTGLRNTAESDLQEANARVWDFETKIEVNARRLPASWPAGWLAAGPCETDDCAQELTSQLRDAQEADGARGGAGGDDEALRAELEGERAKVAKLTQDLEPLRTARIAAESALEEQKSRVWELEGELEVCARCTSPAHRWPSLTLLLTTAFW